jgi:hypothetical protein
MMPPDFHPPCFRIFGYFRLFGNEAKVGLTLPLRLASQGKRNQRLHSHSPISLSSGILGLGMLHRMAKCNSA